MTTNSINLFNAGDSLRSSLIGKMIINDVASNTIDARDVDTYIILDKSGSMSTYLTTIVESYLPEALVSAGLGDQPIKLITFSDKGTIHPCTALTMKHLGIRAGGGTYMRYSIDILKNEIIGSKKTNIRILTISDGELNDQNETVTKASELSSLITGKYNIRSSAIRLFTSNSQPDTRGLASILQLHSNGVSKLIDFKCTVMPDLIEVLSEMLKDDLGSAIKMKASKPIFMVNPWSSPSNEINMSQGENIFWLAPSYSDALITLNGERVSLNETGTLNFGNFENILKNKIDYYINRLKVLNVINTASTKEEVNNIKKYFDSLQQMFEAVEQSEFIAEENPNTLSARIKYFKKRALRNSKGLLQEISTVANQQQVSQLNSLQQADYLRSVTMSSNTINLAKRGLKQGTDFDSEAVREVIEMAKHIEEISDIDDSNHAVSFYSQETTMGGIKALCSLVTDGSITQMGALEILHILNIVGVPCDAVIGDFPDPKTYHINNFLFGSFVSISDVLTVKQLGGELADPFSKKPIKNSIPFYDDDRIHQFLIKYAPTLLEYTASLGMRNLIINVPSTYKYTIVDGLWSMIREVQNSQTDGNISLFVKFVHTYKTAVGTQFDYVMDLIDESKKENNTSLYIGNNGITNMLGPLIAIQNYPEKLAMLPDILRALYTFEYYQVLKKYYRNDSDGYIKRKQFLNDLIGIDMQKYKTDLPKLFEQQGTLNHYSTCHVNQPMFDKVNQTVHWVDYICMAPIMIGHALRNDNNALKTMDNIVNNRSNYEKLLGINFSLDEFKLNCMIQGMMFDTLASRYDSELNKMKIDDPGNKECFDTFLSNYIKEQYALDYKERLDAQHKEEIDVLTNDLVKQMINTDKIDEFITLFKNGLQKNHVSVDVTNIYRPGFGSLKTELFNGSNSCPLRNQKLKIMALGHDENGCLVYNNGNTMGMNPYKLKTIFINLGYETDWAQIENKYIDKNIHAYRAPDVTNHRGHCNTKPSFGAYGFKNLKEFHGNVSKEEFEEYCKVHTHCCGIWDGKPAKWA